MQALSHHQIAQRLDLLIEVSVALGHSPDTATLLDRILKVAKLMTGADGGTLYRPNAQKTCLLFDISINDSLGLYQGGSSGQPVDMPAIPLFDDSGAPNHSSVAAYSANSGKSVNLDNVYQAEAFNFSGMRGFDTAFGYRSQSFLSVPMNDHEGQLIGVLQPVQ